MADILEEIVAWKTREVQIMKEMQPTGKLQRIIEEQTYYKRPPIARPSGSRRQASSPSSSAGRHQRGWINEEAKPSTYPSTTSRTELLH